MVDSSPAIAKDGTVYFGSWDKNFYALTPDGTKKWSFATAKPITSSPAIAADGAVYFGSHDKKFYALDPDGTKRWEFATGGAIISSPAIHSDGTVYFSSVDGNLYALHPDGSVRWRLHTGGIWHRDREPWHGSRARRVPGRQPGRSVRSGFQGSVAVAATPLIGGLIKPFCPEHRAAKVLGERGRLAQSGEVYS